MPKRFSATEIWNEDWFLEMPNEYKLFWFYMLSQCNHAGIFRVNVRMFCGLIGVNIAPSEAAKLFNLGKERIKVVNDSTWFIIDFFVFQYGDSININNRVHASVLKEYKKYGIEHEEIRGLNRSLLDLKDGVKDKDKDKDRGIKLEEPPLLFETPHPLQERFDSFKGWLSSHAPRLLEMQKPFTLKEFGNLFEAWELDKTLFEKHKLMMVKMDNYKDLTKKNMSPYRTLLNWMEKES